MAVPNINSTHMYIHAHACMFIHAHACTYVHTMAACSEGSEWNRSKKSCVVLLLRKLDRHRVGICTVVRSSADSSVEVPMKSKERQAQASFMSQLMRVS